jgi:hypothetical protein
VQTRGREVFEELFPGFTAAAVQAGTGIFGRDMSLESVS